MNFWNGNKSPARQRYEWELLQALLTATEDAFGPWAIAEDRSEYPRAEDEAQIFDRGADLLVTVAGNPKFEGRAKIEIPQPIAKGLLGQRILIVQEDRLAEFAAIETMPAMKARSIGIPATWADAALFRANGFPVVERGSFGELFERLREGAFDYVALGANEVEAAFETMARPLGGLALEPSLLLRYPLPLVFYVHPAQPQLAQRVTTGLQRILATGVLDRVFAKHYGASVERLALERRRVFELSNPTLEGRSGMR